MGVKFWVHLGGKPGRRNCFVFLPVQIEKIETSTAFWECGEKTVERQRRDGGEKEFTIEIM